MLVCAFLIDCWELILCFLSRLFYSQEILKCDCLDYDPRELFDCFSVII